jgi:AraC family transcriptional regulator
LDVAGKRFVPWKRGTYFALFLLPAGKAKSIKIFQQNRSSNFLAPYVMLLSGDADMENRDKEKAVRCMQQYIREHISEPITLHMLAAAASYSPWHAERIFKEVTGQTLFEYLRAVRLVRAAEQLRDTDAKIFDVALDFVFDSHEGFTRAFSKHFGMSPREYRKIAPLSRFFLPHPVRNYQPSVQNGGKAMSGNNFPIFVQVLERPARKVILKRGIKATHYYEYVDEVGCEVEQDLLKVKEALSEIIGLWWPENMRKPGSSIYTLGIEVPANYAGEVPAGFEIVDLPPCKMMFFQGPPCEGEPPRDPIREAMDKYDPRIYGFAWADADGPRFQLAPAGYRGYIEARPVRQINPEH